MPIFEEQVIVITSASEGIGRALVEAGRWMRLVVPAVVDRIAARAIRLRH